MTNEEKILEMLTQMQGEITTLSKKLNVQDEKPEQYEVRQKALIEFINTPLMPEEKKESEEFTEYIAELYARKVEF